MSFVSYAVAICGLNPEKRAEIHFIVSQDTVAFAAGLCIRARRDWFRVDLIAWESSQSAKSKKVGD